MDYQSNSKKSKEPAPAKKAIEKVTTGEVIIKKKPLGQKIKEVFVEADFKSVARYVVLEVLIPAARNMAYDASTKGIERMMFGERSYGRRSYGGSGPRITYNSPINRGDYRSPLTRPPTRSGPIHPRIERNDFITTTKEEAMAVVESMNDILEMYEVVCVADLHELLGFPSTHVDQKWGWTYLGNAQIRPVREGFLIDLPPVEPL